MVWGNCQTSVTIVDNQDIGDREKWFVDNTAIEPMADMHCDAKGLLEYEKLKVEVEKSSDLLTGGMGL